MSAAAKCLPWCNAGCYGYLSAHAKETLEAYNLIVYRSNRAVGSLPDRYRDYDRAQKRPACKRRLGSDYCCVHGAGAAAVSRNTELKIQEFLKEYRTGDKKEYGRQQSEYIQL
jgi:hypothetical protein